jgi:hypothetical protein
MNRPAISLATLLLFGVGATASAQLPAPTTTLQVLFKEASSVEDPTVQAVVSRVRTKLASDTTFAKRLASAIASRDLATVGSLLGTTTQLPRKTIVYGGALKTASTGRGTDDLFRFASNETRARFNPWYLVFSVGGRVYCASTSAATCHDALHKMGYANTEQIW